MTKKDSDNNLHELMDFAKEKTIHLNHLTSFSQLQNR